MKLNQLRPGDNFEFVSLEKMYRNLYVKQINEGSIIIGGEKRGDDKITVKSGEEVTKESPKVEVWRNLGEGYSVSTDCDVKKLKGRTTVKPIVKMQSFIS